LTKNSFKPSFVSKTIGLYLRGAAIPCIVTLSIMTLIIQGLILTLYANDTLVTLRIATLSIECSYA